MKRIVITTLAVAILTFGFGQTMPSPMASEMIKRANTPASLFTGTVAFGLPLYTATAKNGAGVPVGLNYHASGIKVTEIAGPVGLGWQLVAGGSITRVTKGVPDEFASMVNDPATLTHAKLASILNKTLDSEKDLFYFQFPGGQGKFIVEGDLFAYGDEDVWCNPTYTNEAACVTACAGNQTCIDNCATYNEPRLQCEGSIYWADNKTLPYSDLNIGYTYYGGASGKWTITTPQGVVYTFDRPEITTANVTDINGTTYDPNNELVYISTWHLTSIQYPNLPASDNITFDYTGVSSITQEISEYRTFATGSNSGGTLSTDGTEEVRYKTIIGTHYLSKINFSKGSIDFTYASREDLTGGQRLTKVELKDKQGNVVSVTDLNQAYFSAQNSYQEGSVNNCVSAETCKRLKLESVYRDGALVQAYTYRNEEGYSGSGINYYELPPRDSWYFDHWGYWNAGGIAGTTYEKHPKLTNVAVPERVGVTFTLDGMDRAANQYVQANMLTHIDFPTGGYRTYEYESSSGGGVRIKGIRNFDESDNIVSGTTYTYLLPAIVPTPGYHFMYHKDFSSGSDKLVVYQRSRSNVFDFDGPPVGYEKTTVIDEMGQGREWHYFHADARTTEIKPDNSSYSVQDNGELLFDSDLTNEDRPAFSTYSQRYYDRGSYDRIIVKDAAFNVISSRTFVYDTINIPSDYEVANLAVDVKEYSVDGDDVFLSRYDIKSKSHRLMSVVDAYFEGNDSTTTTTNYTYHTTYKTIPVEVETVTSEGYITKSISKLPLDISSSSLHNTTVLGSMLTNNMFGIPVQQESQIHTPENSANEFKTSGVSITSFQDVSGLIHPYRTHVLSLEAPIATGTWQESNMIQVGESTYNSSGLLTQQVGSDGISTTYQYDLDGYLTSATVNGRTTVYEYDPLVGIKKVTDANNRSVSYEYDDRNRLLLTRNNEGNISTRYRYVSDSDPTVPTATINVTYHASGNYEDVAHSFDLSNIACPFGQCSYSWDWGDGTTSGNVTSASHIYSTGGQYTVELTISNPEFTDVIIAEVILIQNNVTPTWSVSFSGSTTIDPNNPGEIYNASITEGVHTCPNVSYSYTWQSRLSGTGSWSTHSATDATATINLADFHALAGSEQYEIKLTVDDACTTSMSHTMTVTIDGTGGN